MKRSSALCRLYPSPLRTIIGAVPEDFPRRAAIREGALALGLSPEQALKHLGEGTYDIYLNDVAYWRNIPVQVWNYYIGGYQVMKKWLSYRERPLLGRSLTPDEVEEVTRMARRRPPSCFWSRP